MPWFGRYYYAADGGWFVEKKTSQLLSSSSCVLRSILCVNGPPRTLQTLKEKPNRDSACSRARRRLQGACDWFYSYGEILNELDLHLTVGQTRRKLTGESRHGKRIPPVERPSSPRLHHSLPLSAASAAVRGVLLPAGLMNV